MRAQAREVGERARVRLAELLAVERRQRRFRQHAARSALGREERELGGEHDVGERERVAHQERARGRERLLDAGEVGVPRRAGAFVRRGLHAAAGELQQIHLHVAREHEARIQERVDARRRVGVVAVQAA